MRKTYPWSAPISWQTPGVLLGLSASLFAAVIFGVIAVVQAAVIRRRGLFTPVMLVVLAAYGIGWLLHLVAIAQLPLYLAQVSVGASLIVTALVASSVMGEPLHAHHWAAVVAMSVGLGLLAMAAGEVGSSEFSTTTTTGLYVWLSVNAVLGLLAWRSGGGLNGPVLGVLAGTAYAGSPVATRSLVDPTLDLTTILPALSIGLFGGLGFLLYSVGMKRASVTAVTAPMVLLSTVIPAVVGLAALGDGVREGWWPPAVLAFVVSVTAGVVLSGAEAHLDLLEEAVGSVGDAGLGDGQPS
jgi:drug/metabolite transporter (DMT)-like permease